jgi:hypothetical protein
MYKVFAYFRNLFWEAQIFGLAGFIRSIIGTITFNLFGSKKFQNVANKKIALITFSINPVFSKTWAYFARKFTDENLVDIFIIDSSGNLLPGDIEGVTIINYRNIEHGKKINRFARLLHYPYIWLCDDDVFFSDSSTQQLVNSNLAIDRLFAISLWPREQKVKSGQVEQNAMGSYCVCFNREVFLKEHLSFRPFTTQENDVNWGRGYYDTADYAHKKALDKNYRVIIAKSEALQSFMGTSIVYLKLRSSQKTAEAFLRETIRISEDWRRISGRLGSAYCLIKMHELFKEVYGVTAGWNPPFSESNLIKFASDLANLQAKERAFLYFERYGRVFEILVRIAQQDRL